jgi:hypothetical protein
MHDARWAQRCTGEGARGTWLRRWQHCELKYLTRVYKAATFPKPRDWPGMDTSLPPAEMKQLLLTHMEIIDQDLRHLADGRAQAVRQWLSGRVDPGRLFVVAPTLNTDGIQDKGKTTRVDLSLK